MRLYIGVEKRFCFRLHWSYESHLKNDYIKFIYQSISTKEMMFLLVCYTFFNDILKY